MRDRAWELQPALRSTGAEAMGRHAVIIGLLVLVGCHESRMVHEVRKPVIPDEGHDTESWVCFSAFTETIDRLERERAQLDELRQTLDDRRATSWARLADALKSDYENVVESDSVGISLYLSQPQLEDNVVRAYAEELVNHISHSKLVEQRCHLLDLALAEGHAWLELANDYQEFHGIDIRNDVLLAKLEIIAEDSFPIPDEPTDDEIAQILEKEFGVIQEAAEAERQSTARAERLAAEERARQREAERLAAEQAARLEAAKQEALRHAELQSQREELARIAQQQEIQELACRQAAALKLYGNAYHSFWDGSYHAALDSLNRAIELNSEDPRCFYYRGLAYLRLGDREAAVSDFERGCELELLQTFTGVGVALERLQGPDRLLVEQYRP